MMGRIAKKLLSYKIMTDIVNTKRRKNTDETMGGKLMNDMENPLKTKWSQAKKKLFERITAPNSDSGKGESIGYKAGIGIYRMGNNIIKKVIDTPLDAIMDKSVFDNVISSVTLSGPPVSVNDFDGVAITSSSIKWMWTDIAKETGYRIKTSTGFVVQDTLPSNTTYFVETGLDTNIGYSRYIESYNGTGVSSLIFLHICLVQVLNRHHPLVEFLC